jgi:hypothetical protein
MAKQTSPSIDVDSNPRSVRERPARVQNSAGAQLERRLKRLTLPPRAKRRREKS